MCPTPSHCLRRDSPHPSTGWRILGAAPSGCLQLRDVQAEAGHAELVPVAVQSSSGFVPLQWSPAFPGHVVSGARCMPRCHTDASADRCRTLQRLKVHFAHSLPCFTTAAALAQVGVCARSAVMRTTFLRCLIASWRTAAQ